MAMAQHPESRIVLLVDDDPDDQDLARLANDQSDSPFDLVIADDGIEAQQILSGAAAGTGGPMPSLILLDLAMPRMDGCELLHWIRQHDELRSTPVVMFTTSTAQNDIDRCYELGCNCFIVKPMSITSLKRVFESLHAYWFELARLPSQPVHRGT
jgi:CheY-like chemotaxis protein